MPLTKEQQKQVEFQTAHLKHKDYYAEIPLNKDTILKNFLVKENVLPPEKMTALFLSRYLFTNKKEYNGKTVIDIGCGTGVQGIVCALFGAKKVILSDISSPAVQNAKINANKFNLESIITVVKGDLFENTPGKSDLIIFNHPFFPNTPAKGDFIALATQNDGELLHRFLDKAKNRLENDGCIIMPFFHKAGETNNPSIQGPKHGYLVEEVASEEINSGLHNGKASIYKLTIKSNS